MLGMLISESLWSGHAWWEVPNLLGSTFYGTRALRLGTDLSILGGAALHFVITGTLGGLFGLACGGIHQRGRLVLLGVLAGVGWYNLANAIFWPRVNPWVPLVSPRPATMFSHLLLGACLGYMGLRQKAPASVSPAGSLEPLPGDSELTPEGFPEPQVAGSPEPSLTGTSEPSFTGHSEPSLTRPSEPPFTRPSGPPLTGPIEPSLRGPSEPSFTGPAAPASDAVE